MGVDSGAPRPFAGQPEPTRPERPLEGKAGVALPQADTYEELVEAQRRRYLAKMDRLLRKREAEPQPPEDNDRDYYDEEIRDAEGDYLLARAALQLLRDAGRIADALERIRDELEYENGR